MPAIWTVQAKVLSPGFAEWLAEETRDPDADAGSQNDKGPTTRVIDPLGNRHPANKVPASYFGGPCRIRTYDQRIKSPLLYQLS